MAEETPKSDQAPPNLKVNNDVMWSKEPIDALIPPSP
eukprot:gene1275-11684_t